MCLSVSEHVDDFLSGMTRENDKNAVVQLNRNNRSWYEAAIHTGHDWKLIRIILYQL